MSKRKARKDIALEAVCNIGRAVEMGLTALLELIYEEGRRLIDVDSFAIGIYDPSEEGLRFELLYDEGERRPPLFTRKTEGWGLPGRVFEERTSLLFKNLAEADLPEGPLPFGEPRSWFGVPLIARERAIGVLVVQSDTPKAFTPANRRLLEAIAGQAAVTIEDFFLHQEHERRIAELSVLSEIGRALSSALELESLLETVYQQVSRVVDTTNFYIATYDPDTDEVTFALDVEGEVRRPRASRKAGQGLTEHIIRTGQPLLLRENVAEWIDEKFGVELIGRFAYAWMGVPLMVGDRVLGVMAVQSYTTPRAYDEQDLALFSTIAAHTAVAIENAHLYQEARRRAEEMEILFTVSHIMAASLEPEETWRAIFETVRRIVPCEAIEACLYDEHNEILRAVMASALEAPDPSEREVYRLGEGFTGRIAQTRQPLLIADVYQETEVRPKSEQFASVELRSYLGVPMILGERLIGTLEIASSEAGLYNAHHVSLLMSMAAQAAAAVERARLFEERRTRAEEMAVLNELGQALAARLNLEQVVEETYRQAARLIDTTNFYIALYDAEKDEITFVIEVESDVRRPPVIRPAGEGLTEHIIRSRTGVHIETSEDYPEGVEGVALVGERAVSWLGVPLMVGDRVLGVMAVQSYTTPGLYDAHDRDLLTAIASQVAIAIENARLFEETQRALEEVRAASERQQQLLNMVRELSTPLVPVTEDILVLPLVGMIDSQRAQQITEVLLEGISSRRARVVILDITGVPVVDTSVANYLLQATLAVRLLGAECILVGITPEVAQTVVGLGVELRGLVTRSDLQGGVEYALHLLESQMD